MTYSWEKATTMPWEQTVREWGGVIIWCDASFCHVYGAGAWAALINYEEREWLVGDFTEAADSTAAEERAVLLASRVIPNNRRAVIFTDNASVASTLMRKKALRHNVNVVWAVRSTLGIARADKLASDLLQQIRAGRRVPRQKLYSGRRGGFLT